MVRILLRIVVSFTDIESDRIYEITHDMRSKFIDNSRITAVERHDGDPEPSLTHGSSSCLMLYSCFPRRNMIARSSDGNKTKKLTIREGVLPRCSCLLPVV